MDNPKTNGELIDDEVEKYVKTYNSLVDLAYDLSLTFDPKAVVWSELKTKIFIAEQILEGVDKKIGFDFSTV